MAVKLRTGINFLYFNVPEFIEVNAIFEGFILLGTPSIILFMIIFYQAP